jgi:hypothetical protein
MTELQEETIEMWSRKVLIGSLVLLALAFVGTAVGWFLSYPGTTLSAFFGGLFCFSIFLMGVSQGLPSLYIGYKTNPTSMEFFQPILQTVIGIAFLFLSIGRGFGIETAAAIGAWILGVLIVVIVLKSVFYDKR